MANYSTLSPNFYSTKNKRFNFETYQDKYYIQGIGGLKEKECGGGSGWMYRVNGVAPNKAAMKYYLEDGDVVEWYYVTNSTDH